MELSWDAVGQSVLDCGVLHETQVVMWPPLQSNVALGARGVGSNPSAVLLCGAPAARLHLWLGAGLPAERHGSCQCTQGRGLVEGW